MQTSPELNAVLAVAVLSVFLAILCWRGMAKWLKKGLLCMVAGIGLSLLGFLAPREHYAEGASYLVTAVRGNRTESVGIQSGAELNKRERVGAYFAIATGGLFLLGGATILARRR